MHVVRGMPTSSGMTYVIKPLAEEQARQGAEVSVWQCEGRRETLAIPDEALVRSRLFPISLPFYNPGISFPFARALSRAISGFDFIHIHAVWNFPTWWTMRCAVRAGVPFMVAPRGSFDPWAMRWHGGRKALYARYVELPLISRAWAVQALTPAEADQTRALGVTAPVEIVPNGIDLSRFECAALNLPARFGTAAGARTVLSLSRLHPKKGIDVLIRGFAEFSAAAPDVHLLIAGQDYQSGYGDVLKQIVAAYGLEQRVHFIGEIHVSEKYRLLRSVDAFALISHSEGMPLGVLEAMAAGLPVIITPGCYIPEAAEAGAGVMVNTEAAEVARALETVFCREGAMAEMGRAGQRLVRERFTWPSIAERTLALYRRACQGTA